jgi:hypothetical protein
MGGGWEGEVGSAADRNIGPPHHTLSPRPAGGEGREAEYQERSWTPVTVSQ